MSLQVREETFSSLQELSEAAGRLCLQSLLFSLPVWLETWWRSFGSDYSLMLRSVRQSVDGTLVGIAPLMRRGHTALLLGSPDVCDYLDFTTASQAEHDFFQALLPALKEEGISELCLRAQRPGAAFFGGLLAATNGRNGEHGNERGNWIKGDRYPVWSFAREDQSYEIDLPADWKGYLALLKKNQRHEVRRKLRRMEQETGDYRYREIRERQEILSFMPEFLELFRHNPEKEFFLTGDMEHYFQHLLENTAHAGLARFGILEVGGESAAAVLFFIHGSRLYLYNSGYHREYSHLSVGLLSKVLCINSAIENGLTIFDFLKGREVYKSRLGGKAIPIYKVSIDLDGKRR